jgi:pyridine nucleotide-disulfide oxidoreductase
VIVPLPRVLRHTRVLTGKIVRIDHAHRLAVFAPTQGPERMLRYDVLVMAAGSMSRVLPVEGLAEYGAGFKTVSEAVHLRNRVLGQLAVAASADDPAIRTAALTFVVVGGGFAGVEALAALQGLADEAVRFHPALDRAELRWLLVEANGRILPELDDRLGQWTLHALRRRGVDVRLHTRLASAAHGRVLLTDGTELAAGTGTPTSDRSPGLATTRAWRRYTGSGSPASPAGWRTASTTCSGYRPSATRHGCSPIGRSPSSSAARPPSSPPWSTPPTTSVTLSAPPEPSSAGVARPAAHL